MDFLDLANLPIAAPPDGQKSDFDSSAPYAKTVWILFILFLIPTFIVVIVRLYVKRYISKQRIAWDDGACIAALCLDILFTALMLKELDYGVGKHIWNIRALSITHYRLLAMTSANLVISLNMLFTRLAILALYQRLFEVYSTSRKLIYFGYFVSVLIAVPEVGNVIGRMVKCTTFLAGIRVRYCTQRHISIAVMAFAIAGLLTDILIYSIAIFRLRILHVNNTKKIQLTAIFAVGLVALLFSIANLTFNIVYWNKSDQLWYALWVALFKLLEADIALTCACATFLPAFWKSKRPAFSWAHSIFRSRSSTSASENIFEGTKPKGLKLAELNNNESVYAHNTDSERSDYYV
ncbi:hypothetical protein K504DRAFT_495844 [Pleomassaria siparia CBS 279.74]|uniref:Rhodopsin domain-containing protein n=1 Tax=Pleomassaria siparia CBS 279.74 TaxID=1314801 RepID=A0A6G1JR40_9PLEO|nr:hypothetical protein K504DRAFT_495844 [Pleomassaria siparia CBS 279.74]